MASLLELVERVNKGELIDPASLEMYQDSANAAEKFLSNHARAMLDLRRSHTFLLEALEAVDYADQKVLFQFLAVLGFLGLSEQRAEPVIKFGAAAINRREVALGMEAIQSGISAEDVTYTRDRDNCAFIAKQYDRAAAAIGWFPPGPCDWNNATLKIGYLTSGVADDEGAARMIAGLSKQFDAKEVKLHVYSTEAAVRREKQTFGQGPFVAASAKRGKETLDALQRRKIAYWSAAMDHDLATCAKELAGQIFRDQIDVLIVDAGLSDPVAAVVSQWPVSRAKINLVRRTPLLAGGTNAAVYVESGLHKNDASTWAKRSVVSHFLQEGVMPAAEGSPTMQRSAFGIPDQSVILATAASEAEGTMSGEFIDTIINALRAHPMAVLLVAGETDGGLLKRRLDAAGLGKRVGFAGKRKDLVEFLRMADVYLTPFPKHNATSTLAAMAAGRATVALAGDETDAQSAVTLLGEEHVSEDAGALLDRVARLIRDPALRAKTGEALKARSADTFGFEHTAAALEQICRDLLPAKEIPAAKAA